MNAIEINALTKSYKDFTLGELSFSLPTGCILGLIGENGGGKTTTLKLLLGITKPDSGSASILGTDIGADIREVKEAVGVVLDEPGIPDCLSARKVNKLMRGIYKHWSEDTYSSLLKRLAIPEDKPYGDFSRGMKMKLGIAIALSHEAKLLILDEPTSGLDPVVRDEVVELFLDFTRDPEHSILISSHIVSDLEKLCDYIAFLHRGKLVLFKDKDELMNEYCLLQCSREALSAIDSAAVIGCRENPYGCSAIVRREAVPAGMEPKPISIEELFIFMVKEMEK